MSHDATNWAIKLKGLEPIQRVLLWHLADCHNPTQGCFPDQTYLAEHCEISRASVNRHLTALEQKGIIKRQRRIDEQTRKQLSTRYFLACEEGFETQDVEVRVSNSDTESRVSDSAKTVSHSSETLTSNRTSKKSLTLKPAKAAPAQDLGVEAPSITFVHAITDEAIWPACCSIGNHRPTQTNRDGGWKFPNYVVKQAIALVRSSEDAHA